MDRYERALAEYTDLAEHGICGTGTLEQRAALLHQLGRDEDAARDLHDAAIQLQKNGGVALRLAKLAFQTGRAWLAARYVQAALDADPRDDASRIMAAEIFMSLDWFDRSFGAVRGLAGNLPPDREDMRGHAENFYRIHHAEALRRLKAYGDDEDRVLDAWELSLALFRTGRITCAATLCEGVMRERPRSFAAFELYAKIVARQHGAGEGLAFLRAVRFLHDGDADYVRMTDLMSRQLDWDRGSPRA